MNKEDFRSILFNKIKKFIKYPHDSRHNNCITEFKIKRYKKLIGFWYSLNQINDISNFILKNNSAIKSKYNQDSINRLLINLCGMNYIKELPINKSIEKVIKKLFSKPKNYYCVLPVASSPSGLSVNKINTFSFINIFPCTMRENIINKHVSKHFKKLLYENHHDITSTYISLSIKANDSSSARFKAFSIVRSFLNSLLVLFDTSTLKYCIKIGPTLYSDFGYQSIEYSSNNYQISRSPYFTMPPLFFNKKHDTKDENSYIMAISKILKKRANNLRLTKLERHILLSNNLIAEGLMTRIRSTKIIKYMSAIESLIEHRGEPISQQIRTKVPTLLSKNKKQQYSDYYKLKSLYHLRSNISHGEYPIILKSDLIYLLRISRAVLITVFHKYLMKNKSLYDLNKYFKTNYKERINFDKRHIKNNY